VENFFGADSCAWDARETLKRGLRCKRGEQEPTDAIQHFNALKPDCNLILNSVVFSVSLWSQIRRAGWGGGEGLWGPWFQSPVFDMQLKGGFGFPTTLRLRLFSSSGAMKQGGQLSLWGLPGV
jgi:hypothetical protein